MIKAVLFDIDGTLLVTGGAGAVAWQRAFRELHGIDANIEEHTHAGMTDPEIAAIVFREVIGREAARPSGRRRSPATSATSKTRSTSPSGYRVMPGIEELLPRLAERGVLLGLVTGNIEAAAHIKLARANLNRFFAFGGYGSDSSDRTELTRKALERGGTVAGHPLDLAATIAVGDTPRDVSAGHGAGIRVVGVATGGYASTNCARPAPTGRCRRRARFPRLRSRFGPSRCPAVCPSFGPNRCRAGEPLEG